MSGAQVQHAFQAEVSEVLSLVVNSLYTHKEVFLRELISNASDAIDQRSFRALTDAALSPGSAAPRIDLSADKEGKTLTISDNGAGMSDADLVRNLGTIAHSGTKKLLQSLSGDQRRDLNLIGQFGVGFYSAFLVADRVAVVSRPAGGDGRAWRWESDGKSGFTVTEATRDEPGTDVVLHMKEDASDFLRDWTIEDLVRKYSDFVRHPIRLRRESEKDGEKTVTWDQVNRGAALWTRPRNEITEEQYTDFYRHVTHDWQPPLAWTHFKVEGTQELTGLLFLPRSTGFELPGQRRRGVRLFVRRVFIMDECEDLVPEWLRFVRGVVDSDDLPLNVSREFLQRDRTSAQLKRHVVRKVLDLLDELAAEGRREPKDGEDDRILDRYAHFWEQCGRILLEGVSGASDDGDRVKKLARFRSTKDDAWTGLADYVRRMPEGQPAIYFVAAESRAAAVASPHTEALRKKGYEVLLAVDPVEEWALAQMEEFEGKKILSAASAALEASDEEKKEIEKHEGALKSLLGTMKEALTDHVRDVRVSARLADSPACLVHEAHEQSPRLERLLRAQDRTFTGGKRVLEVNPTHPFIRKLAELAENAAGDAPAGDAAPSGADARRERVKDLSALLYDQALVAEGSAPSDPARFARQVADMMRASVGG